MSSPVVPMAGRPRRNFATYGGVLAPIRAIDRTVSSHPVEVLAAGADLSDPAAERAIVASLLVHPEAWQDVERLQPHQLADPRLRAIYAAALTAWSSGQRMGPIVVLDELRLTGRLPDAGFGDVGPLELATEAVYARVPHLVEIVLGRSRDRSMRDALLTGLRLLREGRSADEVAPLLQPIQNDQARPVALLSVDDVVQAPPVAWLANRLLPRGGLVVLAGEPAAGKTLLAIDAALRLSTGQDWLGRRCKAASTVYLAGEGATGLGARMRAWRAAHPAARPADGHYVAVHDGIPDLCRPDAVARLAAIVDASERTHERRPDVLVVDTLAMATPGADENDAGAIGAAMVALAEIRRRYACAVVVVHHTRKPSQERGGAGKRTQHDLRGSSALAGAADVVLLATGDTEGDGRALRTVKIRDGESLPPIAYAIRGQDTGRIDEDGAAEIGPVVLPATASQAPTPPAIDDRTRILAAVASLRGQPTTRDTLCTVARVRLVDGRALIDLMLAEGAIRATGTGRRTVYDIPDIGTHHTPNTPRDGGTAAGPRPATVRDGEGRPDGGTARASE